MLSYTPEDTVRKYFDDDETLSPEQINAIHTAWNTTIVISSRRVVSQPVRSLIHRGVIRSITSIDHTTPMNLFACGWTH